MTVEVVPVRPSEPEFDPVCGMFEDYRAHYGYGSSVEDTRSWLHEQLSTQRLQLTAAVMAGQACGFITTTVAPASLTLRTVWLIRDLWVDTEYRRRGVARALLDRVVSTARADHALRVSLQTETDNHAALALYTAAGFQPVTGLELLNLSLGHSI